MHIVPLSPSTGRDAPDPIFALLRSIFFLSFYFFSRSENRIYRLCSSDTAPKDWIALSKTASSEEDRDCPVTFQLRTFHLLSAAPPAPLSPERLRCLEGPGIICSSERSESRTFRPPTVPLACAPPLDNNTRSQLFLSLRPEPSRRTPGPLLRESHCGPRRLCSRLSPPEDCRE